MPNATWRFAIRKADLTILLAIGVSAAFVLGFKDEAKRRPVAT